VVDVTVDVLADRQRMGDRLLEALSDVMGS
jgi:hypothetical protein